MLASAPLSEEACRFYAAELALALGYIHEQGIVHRDVRPENVLLNAAVACGSESCWCLCVSLVSALLPPLLRVF